LVYLADKRNSRGAASGAPPAATKELVDALNASATSLLIL
jgi:hypothetical protein